MVTPSGEVQVPWVAGAVLVLVLLVLVAVGDGEDVGDGLVVGDGLGDAVGLDQFGVNLLRLPDGAWSSQRHWHAVEDEFVWVVSGEVVLDAAF